VPLQTTTQIGECHSIWPPDHFAGLSIAIRRGWEDQCFGLADVIGPLHAGKLPDNGHRPSEQKASGPLSLGGKVRIAAGTFGLTAA
jgi:hypothetical protein